MPAVDKLLLEEALQDSPQVAGAEPGQGTRLKLWGSAGGERGWSGESGVRGQKGTAGAGGRLPTGGRR